jgi:hypothetical protein
MRASRTIVWMAAGMLGAVSLSAQQANVPGASPAQDIYNNSVHYARGQSLQPVFEGWEKNPDGTFSMWFGYLNRNYEEKLNIAVGPDNGFNGEDMGQPEFFEPRRQQFAFKIDVPSTFPKDKDLVWTIKANGVTLKAYGCLWPVWEIDANTISANRGSRTAIDFDEPPNEAPQVVDPPPPQTIEVHKPLALSLSVVDDGNPKPRTDRGARVAGIKKPSETPEELPINQSLRVSWLQWRGPGIATFDPRVARVVDGKATTKVTFDKPGRYVLRGYAEDASIHTPHDVQVTVVAATATPQR